MEIIIDIKMSGDVKTGRINKMLKLFKRKARTNSQIDIRSKMLNEAERNRDRAMELCHYTLYK